MLVKGLPSRRPQHGVVVHFIFNSRLDFCLFPLHGRRVALCAAVVVGLVAVSGVVRRRLRGRAFEANGFVDAHALVPAIVVDHVPWAPAVRGAPLSVGLELPRRAPLAHEPRRCEGQGAVDGVVARHVKSPELLFHARHAVTQRREVGREQKRQRKLGSKVDAVAKKTEELFIRPLHAVGLNPVDVEGGARVRTEV